MKNTPIRLEVFEKITAFLYYSKQLLSSFSNVIEKLMLGKFGDFALWLFVFASLLLVGWAFFHLQRKITELVTEIKRLESLIKRSNQKNSTKRTG